MSTSANLVDDLILIYELSSGNEILFDLSFVGSVDLRMLVLHNDANDVGKLIAKMKGKTKSIATTGNNDCGEEGID
jgi:hypothetical protein